MATQAKRGLAIILAVQFLQEKIKFEEKKAVDLFRLQQIQAEVDRQIKEAKKEIKEGKEGSNQADIVSSLQNKLQQGLRSENLKDTEYEDWMDLQVPTGEAPGEQEIIKKLKGFVINELAD